MGGCSVALSADGNTAIVGGYFDTMRVGAAWGFINSVPLPVELVSFSGTTDGVANTLIWRTASETNSARFDIERRIGQNPGWITVGSLMAGGTTSVPRGYSFKDAVTTSGTYVYLLEEMDRNGAIHFSSEISLETLPRPGELVLSPNYPNPFNPSTKISFTLPSNTFVAAKMFDALGREVETLASGNFEAGTYTREWNADKSASGVYFCGLQAGNPVKVRSLLLLR